MPLRRSTDKFAPEPMPKDENDRKQQQWYMMSMAVFQLSRVNGRVADNSEDIIRIDKDVSVARKLGWIALSLVALVGGVGGLIALF